MIDKLLLFIVALPVILILALVCFLGFGIAVLVFGIWTILGICLVIISVIIAIVPPHLKVWIPLLILGIVLIVAEQINIL